MNSKLKSEHLKGVEYKYGAEWIKRLESQQHWRF